MIFKLIYYFCILQCQNEKKEKFKVILERKDITDLNIAAFFDEFENNKASVFLWDKHFPKPFFYLINQNELLKLTLINDTNTLFMAKIDYANETINTIKINRHETLDKDNVNDYDFAIICKNQNIDSIRNSLIYKLKVESIRPLYVELVKFFVGYSNEIRNYRVLVENTIKYYRAFTQIWRAQTLSMEVTNAAIKGLALLNLPIRSKLEFVSPIKFYVDQFNKVAELVGESLLACNLDLDLRRKSGTLYKSQIDTFSRIAKEHFDYIMSSRNKEQSEIIFNQIANKMYILEDFVNETVRKDNANEEIASDCDAEKVKTFVDKYFDILYEYCEVMEKFDETYLTDYVLSIASKEKPAEKILEKFYTDKLIARELKKYLHDSYNDLTNLKIFSQTDYFKKDFSKNLLNNLVSLISDKETEKIIRLRFDGKNVNTDIREILRPRIYIDHYQHDGLLEDELNYVTRFYKNWSEILYDPYEEITFSMEDLVNDKKIGGNIFKRVLRYIRDFFMKYLFINLCIIIFGIPILIRLIFKRNNYGELTFNEYDTN